MSFVYPYTVIDGHFVNFLIKIVIFSQEDQDGGQSVGQRKRVKLSSNTKGK